ncbi:IclR family transcriptional regulator [Paenibacillus hamazuiensis]|uniref:IclR family transcriptional regulator n=1 Tax=Paenibacillus hamazuiensis TaxID=2936508 RepID=UPI00200F60CE|nr:IclR family transcriptional regulator [Paenibacillus hamazuiensis]
MPIIQSVERALQILNLFDEQTTELKITEISKRMNLHKSTVHSLLKTLEAYRYIKQDEESGKYRLGMALFERGNLLLQTMDVRSVARKYLLELSAQTGQTVNLVILDGNEGVYIDKVEGPKAAIRYSRIGRRIPLHCSAVGKALGAYLKQEELMTLLQNYRYERRTPQTIDNEADFLRELAAVREQGVAYDREENEPGVRCAAVPVRDHTGQVVAAVSLSMLVSGVDDHMFEGYVRLLKQTAADISAHMGYKS